MSLTIFDLADLARAWCPRVAVRRGFLAHALGWGPAHEIGHALISLPHERALPEYGIRCSIGFCKCQYERCHVVELAAMRISAALVVAAGMPALADEERKNTEDYDLMVSPAGARAARRMVVRRVGWPVPRTRVGVERLLRERLGAGR